MDTGPVNSATNHLRPTRIGVFGGSFNPIHNGHIRAVNLFMDRLRLDETLLVPSGAPFYKRTYAVPFEHRYRMCQLAAQELPGVSVSDVEENHVSGMYSCDMLAAVKRLHPDAELFFLVGSDVYERVPVWKGIRRIAELATFAAIVRTGNAGAASRMFTLTETAELLKKYGARTVFIQGGRPLSSTAVRAEAEQRRSLDGLVPAVVADYIREHHLYAREGA